jgi:predicted RNA binding protein YcfA (HicA-like mRNA interferase family)
MRESIFGRLFIANAISGFRSPSPYTMEIVKVRDLVRMIESDGWRHVRTTGSHKHFKHAIKSNVVTVPRNSGDDIPIGTLKAILRAAGLEGRK